MRIRLHDALIIVVQARNRRHRGSKANQASLRRGEALGTIERSWARLFKPGSGTGVFVNEALVDIAHAPAHTGQSGRTATVGRLINNRRAHHPFDLGYLRAHINIKGVVTPHATRSRNIHAIAALRWCTTVWVAGVFLGPLHGHTYCPVK